MEAIEASLAADESLTEPGVAHVVAASLPADVELVVASSMPVRDLEWFGGPLARAHANRGANGIDGVVSTALGRALTGTPTVALVGDIAFVHDSNALVRLRDRSADLRIVVVDNDGGGIFSFLPQATALPADQFETLLGTPHGTDIEGLARAHGIPATTITDAGELAERLDAARAVARPRPDEPRRQRRRPRPPQRRRRRRPRLKPRPVCFIRPVAASGADRSGDSVRGG